MAEHEADEVGVVVCHCGDDLGSYENVFEEDYEGDNLEPHVSIVGSRHFGFESSQYFTVGLSGSSLRKLLPFATTAKSQICRTVGRNKNICFVESDVRLCREGSIGSRRTGHFQNCLRLCSLAQISLRQIRHPQPTDAATSDKHSFPVKSSVAACERLHHQGR